MNIMCNIVGKKRGVSRKVTFDVVTPDNASPGFKPLTPSLFNFESRRANTEVIEDDE